MELAHCREYYGDKRVLFFSFLSPLFCSDTEGVDLATREAPVMATENEPNHPALAESYLSRLLPAVTAPPSVVVAPCLLQLALNHTVLLQVPLGRQLITPPRGQKEKPMALKKTVSSVYVAVACATNLVPDWLPHVGILGTC